MKKNPLGPQPPAGEGPRVSREKVLVVIPYGMCFRNVVLNRVFWRFLTSRYEVGVWTPLNLKDPERLGIARVQDYHRAFRSPWRWVNQRLWRSLIAGMRYMRELDFYFYTGLPHIVNFKYLRMLRSNRERRRYFLWHWIGYGPAGAIAERILEWLEATGAVKAALRDVGYKCVVLTHTSEESCVHVGRVAGQLGIPVVAIPLGLDNLSHHGPLLFRPDLVLACGPEQEREFRELQAAFNPHLQTTKCKPVGCLVFDRYLEAQPGKDLLEKRYGIGEHERVILFATSIEGHHKGHLRQCESILDEIRLSGGDLRLVVRVRPGLDEEMWMGLAKRHPKVVLQIPSGSTYDKSSRRDQIDEATELADLNEFVATLRRASLVITAGFSSVYLDAALFGTPATVVGYNDLEVLRHCALRLYLTYSLVRYPSWREYNVVFDDAELRSVVHHLVEVGKAHDRLPTTMLAEKVLAPDGQAGRRAADAMKAFFGETSAVPVEAGGLVFDHAGAPSGGHAPPSERHVGRGLL